MDRLVVSLLNTAADVPDPLETPLGTARWWAAAQGAAPALPLPERKPRFDAALSSALRALRASLASRIAGEGTELPLAFRADASDAILFTLTHAACSAIAGESIRRVRRCSGRACARYFLDRTKNGSRRWCSLRCMERARAPRRRTL